MSRISIGGSLRGDFVVGGIGTEEGSGTADESGGDGEANGGVWEPEDGGSSKAGGSFSSAGWALRTAGCTDATGAGWGNGSAGAERLHESIAAPSAMTVVAARALPSRRVGGSTRVVSPWM